MMDTTNAAMLIRFIALSTPASTWALIGAWLTGATGVMDGAGRFTSGCVCCIFTVAFGSTGLAAPSGGSVMRAVSFFGAAARWPTGAAGAAGAGAPAGAPPAGAGRSGTVGRGAGAPPMPGGFGAPTPGSGGFGATPAGGGGTLGAEGTAGAEGTLGAEGMAGAEGGAPGTKGLAAAAGTDGGGIEPMPVSFVVSFFGATPPGTDGLPGKLIRTVSRLIACCSCLGGRVIRMVSALEASSDSEGAGGISSAIEGENVLRVYLTQPFASQPPYPVLRELSLARQFLE